MSYGEVPGMIRKRFFQQAVYLMLASVVLSAVTVRSDESDPEAPSTSPADPTVVKSVSAPAPPQAEKPLSSLKATLSSEFHSKIGTGELPENRARLELSRSGVVDAQFHRRPWGLSGFTWEASASRHLPLLFEEPNLERMGYPHACPLAVFGPEECWWTDECIQPAVSGAHFLGNLAIAPYRCGVQPACEPVYTLGHDRPGSPACYRRHRLPLDVRGALFQTGFVTGLVFLIP